MVLDSFKRFYSDSFNSSILVSNFLTSRAKSIEDILLELESHLCKIRLRIASCVTTCYDDLASRILNLSRLHLALQDLEFRIMFFKKEVKNSNFVLQSFLLSLLNHCRFCSRHSLFTAFGNSGVGVKITTLTPFSERFFANASRFDNHSSK